MSEDLENGAEMFYLWHVESLAVEQRPILSRHMILIEGNRRGVQIFD